MAKSTGLFSGLLGPSFKDQLADEKAEDQRFQFQAQDPFRAAALASYEAADAAGKGIGRVVAAAAGRDPRTTGERQTESVERAKAAIGAMEDVDLTSPAGVDSYYKGVINILRQNNLPAEAHAAAQEWNDYKSKAADRKVKEDDLARKTAADQAKAAADKRKNELTAERNQALAQRGVPEIVQIIERIEKETDPATRDYLTRAANAHIESKKKGVILENLNDRVVVRDKATGAIIGTDTVGEKPLAPKDRLKREDADKQLGSAYRSAMLAMQTSYKAAADLYNSRGLDNLIGKWTGIAAEQGPEKGGLAREAFIARLNPAGQEALGLFQQVQGATFIQALLDLKAAGKGSTGLGAVSEVEGNKIQAAKAALWPRQQPASFRRKLADYIGAIEAAANLMADKAQEEGLDPVHLNVVPLSGPTRGGGPAPAPVTPRAPQQSEQPTSESTVRMVHPQKGVRNVFRSKVEEAKRRGYTEAQ